MATFRAIIYFHGMGNQERYGELSRMVNSLVRVSLALPPKSSQAPNAWQHLSAATAHNEPLGTDGKDIGYLSVQRFGDSQELRCYEVYWGPITAGKSSALEVLRWMLPQAWNAFRLLTSGWSGQGRMRRLTLHQMWSLESQKVIASGLLTGPQGGTVLTNLERTRRDSVYRRLLQAYEHFVDPTTNPTRLVSFPQFLQKWLRALPPAPTGSDWIRPSDGEVTELATAWQLQVFRNGCRDLFALLLLPILVVQVIVTLVSLMASSITLLGRVSIFKELNATVLEGLDFAKYIEAVQKLTVGYVYLDIYQWFVTSNEDQWWIVVVPLTTFIIAWLLLWALQAFLRDFMGDVQQWTTYQENDTKNQTREAILDRSRAVLTHVLGHKDCSEVTIVAHSLGSTIAYDSICRLVREVKAGVDVALRPDSANQRLKRLKYFISAGCPIDKIYFFFESRRLQFKELSAMLEHQRSDIGAGQLQDMLWLNFYDQGDPISGTVFSVNPALSLSPCVQNIEVSSYAMPTVASHGGYFEHVDVLGQIYAAAFGELDGKVQPAIKNQPVLTIGSTGQSTLFYLLVLSLPALALLNFAPWLGFTIWTSSILITVTLWLLIRSGLAMRRHSRQV